MDTAIVMNITCHTCGEMRSLVVPRAGYNEWKGGTLIQKALPQMSVGDRELMISGTCSDCFDRMFEEDEDEEG